MFKEKNAYLNVFNIIVIVIFVLSLGYGIGTKYFVSEELNFYKKNVSTYSGCAISGSGIGSDQLKIAKAQCDSEIQKNEKNIELNENIYKNEVNRKMSISFGISIAAAVGILIINITNIYNKH